MSVSQTKQATALLAAMHALDERAVELERGADGTALDWQPPDGGWSAGQVFEHLCVANDSYLVALRRILAGGSAGGSRGAVEASWRPSFAGRLLVRSMESPRKLPAPKIWRPAPTPRPNVIVEFLERQREIESLIERSRSIEWRRVRLASPISGFIRMNGGDAFTLLVRHAERHFRQIDRVLAASRAAGAGQAFAGR